MNGQYCAKWARQAAAYLVSAIAIFSLLSSCSWISKRRTLFNNENPEDQTVPKAQYDQLLEKYESVIKQSEAAPQGIGSEKVDLVTELNKVSPGAGDLVETVDVFPNEKNADGGVVVMADYDSERIKDDMMKLETGRMALEANKYDEALKSLKEAETSPARPIATRAKFYLGELLFRQQEFDLAMQIFEDILTKDAYSSNVLSALGRLVVCAEKLKLTQKRERYHSLLHDFLSEKDKG